MKHGGRIDASRAVLGGAGASEDLINFSNARSGAHLPPFLSAAFENEVLSDPAENRPELLTGGQTRNAGPWVQEYPHDADTEISGPPKLSFRDFDRLSLAARLALVRQRVWKSQTLSYRWPKEVRTEGIERDDWDQSSDSQPLPLKPCIKPRYSAWNKAAVRCGLNIDAFPLVEARDILKVLAHTADELGPDQGRDGQGKTAEQLAMRGGLQLIGCRIISNTNVDGLRLVNARLPISLRLIGCVIECPLLLAHCELVSLDLSGSALVSLDATGLRASGNVYMRRTVVHTPVSLSGCNISGSLDASDCVVAPFRRAAPQTPVHSDHGILNLSRATIDNEVRLERARIWGGVSLRGARIGRSLFLNHALLISPLGLMEKFVGDLAHAWLKTAKKSDPRAPAIAAHLAESEAAQLAHLDRKAAKRLHDPGRPYGQHPPPPADYVAALTEMETLEGETNAWANLNELTLRRMKIRAVTAALRADGATIDGSVFARAVFANGRLRMRYARIGGSVRLDGAWLRSSRACQRSIRQLLKPSALHATFKKNGVPDSWISLSGRLQNKWRRIEEEEIALDLRATEIEGDLALGGDPFDQREQAKQRTLSQRLPRRKNMPTLVQGRITLRGLRTTGGISFNGLISQAPPVRISAESQARSEGHSSAFDATWTRQVLAIDMEKVATGQDIDFRTASGVCGVCLDNARIGGNLKFADKTNGRTEPDASPGYVRCRNRAVDLRGSLSMRGAKIGGNAFLLFDARNGPVLTLNNAEIGGRLDIYPQVRNSGYQPRATRETAGSVVQRRKLHALRRDGFWLQECDHPRLRTSDPMKPRVCRSCRAVLDHVDEHRSPYIDLRQARAASFAHPPAAWPDPGALSLDGFRYELASDLGPLAPMPPQAPLAETTRNRQEQYRWRHRPIRRHVIATMGFCCLIAVVLLMGVTFWWKAHSLPLSRDMLSAPLVMLMTGGLLTSILMVQALRFLAPGLRWRPGRWAWIHSDQIRPRALEYLGRQRIAPNRFKARPSNYHVLDSYVRAARALRESGRYISANLVEEQRLRLRTRMLSWRHHGAAKLMLNLVDMFAGYGFHLSRAGIILGGFVLATAMLAHVAAVNGHLVGVRNMNEDLLVHSTILAETSEICGRDAVQACPSLIYALDLVVPFIDLDETRRWRTTIPIDAPRPDRQPWLSAWLFVNQHWPSLIKALGLLLSAVLVTAVAARIESAFARVEE